MESTVAIASTYRSAAVALALSALLHGAVVIGVRMPSLAEPGPDLPEYRATLEAAPAEELRATPEPQARPAVKPQPPRARPAPRAGETVAFLPDALAQLAPAAEAPEPPEPALAELPAVEREVVALAAVSAATSASTVYSVDAFPAEVTIQYALNSLFAEGQAEYSWRREGGQYEITGTAQAVGFFSMFLEGQLYQVTNGHITPEGLRPDRFTERLGSGPEEGLTFDWDARTVQFQYSDKTRTAALTDGATVDWLSMIFQLAQRPPRGQSMLLRVYTQRRMVEYRLQVLGLESLDLPLGRVQALHLRHLGEKPADVVDVWLGVDHHYLPLKLRYPVARNRLVVEQTAVSVKAR